MLKTISSQLNKVFNNLKKITSPSTSNKVRRTMLSQKQKDVMELFESSQLLAAIIVSGSEGVTDILKPLYKTVESDISRDELEFIHKQLLEAEVLAEGIISRFHMTEDKRTGERGLKEFQKFKKNLGI